MADIPLDPRLQQQLLDLYSQSNNRIASTAPIHQAAMAMATRLAPGYARQAMGPVPQPSAPLSTGNFLQQGGLNSTTGKIAMAAIASILANSAKNGGGGNIGDLIKQLIDHFRGNTPGNYPTVPGDGFGGPNTTTVSGNDVDNGFTGPVNDPYGFGGPDATYEPGGYNFSGPQLPDPGTGGTADGGDEWNP